jgi:cell wall-associated NlpC family hydrolase
LPVSDLVAGNIMQLISESNGFYKISFPDKRMAYIPVKKARLFDQWKDLPDPGAEEILRTARNFLGIPYLWGGTSVKGMDCSGFTKTSYFLNGIVLPRDASQQALVGEKLDINVADTVDIAKSLKTLKAGDLLFFAANKLTRRVTHTAIYIGNGEFIQAAGLVRINSMIKGAKNYDDFQSRTMVGARRMLTAIGEPEVTRVNKHPYYQRIINQ